MDSIAAAANASLLAHANPGSVQYLVREPTPRLQGGGSLAVAKEPHGLASSVTIRPLGWEPVLSLDGLSPHRLPTSSSITIEIEPEKKLWLHTASF